MDYTVSYFTDMLEVAKALLNSCLVFFFFQAYASGCDIVVLGTDFERLQIIPGAKHGNIQVGCVDCSMQQGKVCRAVFLRIF